ncbi:MAG: DUF2336 domain-containing protein [Holosporales bacterium]|jgi:hypothetical protein
MSAKSKPDAVNAYAQARQLAFSALVEERLRAASAAGAPPEILYLLARDPNAAVRRAVAKNTVAPHHADLLLAKDKDEHTREALMDKTLNRFDSLPNPAPVPSFISELLHIFVKEPLRRLRIRLAEALADSHNTPRDIARDLALDPDEAVARPIVQRSPVLIDADFEVIATKNPNIANARTPNPRATAQPQGMSEETILRAIIARDKIIVIKEISERTRITPSSIERLIASGQAKTITALCWKAGLSATTALQLQRHIARLAPKESIRPRQSGGYALSDKECRTLLNILIPGAGD